MTKHAKSECEKYLHGNYYYKMRNTKKQVHKFCICIEYIWCIYVCVESERTKSKNGPCSVIGLRLDTPTPTPRQALQRCKLHFHNLWGPNNCLHLILQSPFVCCHTGKNRREKSITRMKEMNTAGLGNSIN